MSSPSGNIVLVCGTVLAVAAIGTTAALTWHGSVTGSQFITFLSSLGLAGVVATVAHVATSAGVRVGIRESVREPK